MQDTNARCEPAFLERLLAMAQRTALEQMAGGLAHELNQPLGAIVTFAQAAERMLDRPDVSLASVREVLQLISKEALGAGEGIRRMREPLQRESPTRISCTVSELLAEITPILQEHAARADALLQIELSPELPLVCIERLEIQCVLFALAQNAFEAALLLPITARSVRITAHADRYGLEISVIDAGPGISAEHHRRVFHPFFSTKPRGSGLGLAAARAIIEAHEGSIGFEAAGPGTRFWFRVPSCDPSAAVEAGSPT